MAETGLHTAPNLIGIVALRVNDLHTFADASI